MDKSGTIALVLLDLTAGWQAGWLAGRRVASAKFRIFKISYKLYRMKHLSFRYI